MKVKLQVKLIVNKIVEIEYNITYNVNGWFKMSIYHKTSKDYIPYSFRIESDILDKIREIAGKEDLTVNETLNQSLRFAIDNYKDKK